MEEGLVLCYPEVDALLGVIVKCMMPFYVSLITLLLLAHWHARYTVWIPFWDLQCRLLHIMLRQLKEAWLLLFLLFCFGCIMVVFSPAMAHAHACVQFSTQLMDMLEKTRGIIH